MRRFLPAIFMFLIGCPRSSPQPEPQPPPTVEAVAEDEGVPDPTAPAAGDAAQAEGGGAVGDACSTADDCDSGICEGKGCEPGQGRCMDAKRMCTRDLRAYCGCDGETFRSSGSCPGRRFAYEGPCRDEDEPSE